MKCFFVFAMAVATALCVEQFWTLEHCEPSELDVVNFQVYLKWSNDEMLTAFVQTGSSASLPFDARSTHSIEEALSYWRFFLKPRDESFNDVTKKLENAGIEGAACVQQWDSIHCSSIPVRKASQLFGKKLCSYQQNLDVVLEKNPSLNGRKNGRFWLIRDDENPLSTFSSHVKYISGVNMFDPTNVAQRSPITGNQNIKNENNLDPFLWPINTGSNGPVIISGLGLPQFGALSAMGAMTIAVNCKDGTPTNASISSWCKNANDAPAQLTVSVEGKGGNVSVNLTSSICGAYGSNLPTNSTEWSDMVVCNFEAHPLVIGLETWGRYKVTAIAQFADGSVSNLSTMMNFWQGAYQSLMEVTIPNPMTPKDIRELYGIPEGEVMTSNMSAQGILEFSDTLDPRQGFLVSDLRAFLIQYGIVNESYADVYLSEFLVEVGTSALESRGETSLDIEMMMSLARGARTYLWNIINGPGLQYVHWAQGFIAWAHNVTSGNAPSSALPPSVWSISYGGGEWNTTSDSLAEATVLNDYFKLMTASGITVVVSSGDSGAGFQTAAPLVSYPASSPYVVSVGATAQRRIEDGSVVQAACSAADGNVITTGGAFSQFFDVPEYQASAVKNYVDAHPGYPAYQMSASQRAVPDIATIGAWVNILISNGTIPVFGTSIAAPVLSSMISLANDKRREQGLGPIALANWMIYKAWESDAYVFDDVNLGSNCAGEQYLFPANFPTYGWDACFNATIGWDPVSGVGAPRYLAFKAFALDWNVTSSSSPSTSHTGAIVGGTIGGVAAVAIIAFIFFRVRASRLEDAGEYMQI
jgi:hypothetical protein